MTPQEYQKYLQTAHWQSIRDRMSHSRCRCCSGTNKVQIHHVTYERLYSERDEDLRVLCKFCHVWVHDCIYYCFAPLDRTDWFIELWKAGVRAYIDVRQAHNRTFGPPPDSLLTDWRKERYQAVCRKIAGCKPKGENVAVKKGRGKHDAQLNQAQRLLEFWRRKRAEMTGTPLAGITSDMARSFRKNKFGRHERRRMEQEYLAASTASKLAKERPVAPVDTITAFNPPERTEAELQAMRKMWNFNK